jgi:hypothetical protein
MPIQIIPKEAAQLPLWQNISFYFSIGLIFSILASYGVLYHFTKTAETEATNIDISIQQGKTQQMITLEKELKNYKDIIDAFSYLIANHNFSSNFFGKFEYKTGILEKNTHPQVLFSDMDFNVKTDTVSLSGVAENIAIVGQQVALFQNDKIVRSVKLSKADINKEGKIEFTLDLYFDPELLKSFCGDGVVEGAEECDGEKGVPENFVCTRGCTLESIE